MALNLAPAFSPRLAVALAPVYGLARESLFVAWYGWCAAFERAAPLRVHSGTGFSLKADVRRVRFRRVSARLAISQIRATGSRRPGAGMLTVHRLRISQSRRGSSGSARSWNSTTSSNATTDALTIVSRLTRARRCAPWGSPRWSPTAALCSARAARFATISARGYGGERLVPGRDDPDFADHLFWFHWSNRTFMTTLMMQLVLAGGGEGNPAAVFVEDRSRRSWAMVEARLQARLRSSAAPISPPRRHRR